MSRALVHHFHGNTFRSPKPPRLLLPQTKSPKTATRSRHHNTAHGRRCCTDALFVLFSMPPGSDSAASHTSPTFTSSSSPLFFFSFSFHCSSQSAFVAPLLLLSLIVPFFPSQAMFALENCFQRVFLLKKVFKCSFCTSSLPVRTGDF